MLDEMLSGTPVVEGMAMSGKAQARVGSIAAHDIRWES
jgi:hypothetical protein